jgi:hypothetical protein
MPADELVSQTRDTFTRLRLQANHDMDALRALVDLMAYIGAESDPMHESKVFLKSCGWWPMDRRTRIVLGEHVHFDRGNIVWRGYSTDGEPTESVAE